jgi:hypothetical protein
VSRLSKFFTVAIIVLAGSKRFLWAPPLKSLEAHFTVRILHFPRTSMPHDQSPDASEGYWVRAIRDPLRVPRTWFRPSAPTRYPVPAVYFNELAILGGNRKH